MDGNKKIPGDLNNLHLLETDILKRQWMTYVFEAVEKLHDKVEVTTLQVQKEREEFFRSLVELKDTLNDKIFVNSKEQTADLKLLEDKLTKLIDETVEKIKTSADTFDEQLSLCSEKQTTCIENMKEDVEDKIKDIVTDQITVKLNLTEVKSQFGAYVAIIVIGVNVVLGVLTTSLVVIFKDALRNWLGY
jgi:DNA anti-recombination protein RmuC